MSDRLNDEWFRVVRESASDAVVLQQRARAVLNRRALNSFDGFGHFLDEVLSEDSVRVERVALTIRIAFGTLERLRSSRLDPFSVAPEPLANLVYILGLGWEDAEKLLVRDHRRFSTRAADVSERGSDAADGARLELLRNAWGRILDDDATNL